MLSDRPPAHRDASLPPFGEPHPPFDSSDVRLAFWLNVDGPSRRRPDDEPHLIAYRDGRVIYRRALETWFEWFEVQLPPGEVDALADEVATWDFVAMEPMAWCLPGWWSRPMTRIAVHHEDEGWLVRQVAGVDECEIAEAARATTAAEAMTSWVEERWRTGRATGELGASERAPSMTEVQDEHASYWPIAPGMPTAFSDAYRRLRDWSHPHASPLVPRELALSLRRVTPGSHGGDTAWPDGVPRPPAETVSGSETIHYSVEPQHHRDVTRLDQRFGVERPNRTWGGHSWQIRVERSLPEQRFLEEMADFADEVACAWDMRERLQCTLDHPRIADEDRYACVEAMRPATEIGRCRAQRGDWRALPCREAMRCGW